jgi:hypothetical protein
VQPLDQDPFIYEAEAVDADVAFATFEAVRRNEPRARRVP